MKLKDCKVGDKVIVKAHTECTSYKPELHHATVVEVLDKAVRVQFLKGVKLAYYPHELMRYEVTSQ